MTQDLCKCGHKKRAHSISLVFCRVPFCDCKKFIPAPDKTQPKVGIAQRANTQLLEGRDDATIPSLFSQVPQEHSPLWKADEIVAHRQKLFTIMVMESTIEHERAIDEFDKKQFLDLEKVKEQMQGILIHLKDFCRTMNIDHEHCLAYVKLSDFIKVLEEAKR
jgi:hypothetical protein